MLAVDHSFILLFSPTISNKYPDDLISVWKIYGETHMSDTFVVVSGATGLQRNLAVSDGFHIVDAGPTGSLTISPGSHLDSLVAANANGWVGYQNLTKTYTPRTFLSSATINVNGGDGSGSPTWDVVPGSSVQRVRASDGITTVTSSDILFTAGAGIVLGVTNNAGKAEVTVSSTGAGMGSVTSVAVTSSDITVGGSPITTAGTITLALNTVSIAKGGTGQTTKQAAFDALAPTAVLGDMLYFNNINWVPLTGGSLNAGLVFGAFPTWQTPTVAFNTWSPNKTLGSMIYNNGTDNVSLPAGTNGYLLTMVGGIPAWAAAPAGGVTSVGVTSNNAFIAVSNSPITSTGNIALSVGTLPLANGGLGAAYPTSAAGSVAIYLANDTRLRPSTAGAGNPNAMLRCDTNGNPNWTAAATLPGQVMVIGPGGIGATWCNNPTANGQVLTYVSSGAGASWVTPTGGSGTVTSVNAASSNGSISIGGGPITTSGSFNMLVDVGQTLKLFFPSQVTGVEPLNAGQTTYTIGTNQILNTSAVFLSVGQAGGATWNPVDLAIQAKMTSRTPVTQFTVTLSQAPVASGTAVLSWFIVAP